MKNSLIILVLLAANIGGMSSCKKCFNCTITNTCYKCTVNGVNSATYCSQDYTSVQMDAAHASCLAAGGAYSQVSSTNNVTEYCDKPSNTANISNMENNCETAGGVWTNK